MPTGTINFMNFDYRLANNHRCIWSGQCYSGYCKKGGCHDPENIHDPCRPEIRNCPKHLKCSKSSRTCVPAGYKSSKVCITASDCKYNESCLKGTCHTNIPIGDKCFSVRPDLCAMGSKCTVALSNSEPTKCYQLCNSQVSCHSGYKCIQNIWNSDSICIQDQDQPSVVKTYSVNSNEAVKAIIVVLAVIIVLLGIIYGWIRITRSGPDPRLKRSSDKKKKKKRVRLNYEGNGLATITVIPSNCQSPLPVAASQLFNVPINEPPPAYSEAINIR
jgi:hypothetical protein